MGDVEEEEDGSGSKNGVDLVLGLGLRTGSPWKKKVDDRLSLSLGVAVKRERDMISCGDEQEVVNYCSNSNSNSNTTPTHHQQQHNRKKLRLTHHQSALLEDCFKQHTTLNPKQKQALAKQLNLRPRQVEVWFQNRRARTKVKQTEVDCEFLNKCCETLRNENRRLQKELEELKAVKMGHMLYSPATATATATLSICPSCHTLSSSSAC